MIEYVQLKSSCGMIRGTVHNSHYLNDSQNLVLILHGYLSSNRIGPNRLYFYLANIIADRMEIPVARFDCYGMGESDGDMSNIKYEDFIQSFKNVLNYFTEKYPGIKITLIGHCIGANAAVELSYIEFNSICGLILISPYFCSNDSLMKIFTSEQLHELTKKGQTERKGITVNSSFIYGWNILERVLTRIQVLPHKWHLIIGGCDELIDYSFVKLSFPISRISEISTAGHNYLSDGEKNALANSIVTQMDIFKK